MSGTVSGTRVKQYMTQEWKIECHRPKLKLFERRDDSFSVSCLELFSLALLKFFKRATYLQQSKDDEN